MVESALDLCILVVKVLEALGILRIRGVPWGVLLGPPAPWLSVMHSGNSIPRESLLISIACCVFVGECQLYRQNLQVGQILSYIMC